MDDRSTIIGFSKLLQDLDKEFKMERNNISSPDVNGLVRIEIILRKKNLAN